MGLSIQNRSTLAPLLDELDDLVITVTDLRRRSGYSIEVPPPGHKIIGGGGPQAERNRLLNRLSEAEARGATLADRLVEYPLRAILRDLGEDPEAVRSKLVWFFRYPRGTDLLALTFGCKTEMDAVVEAGLMLARLRQQCHATKAVDPSENSPESPAVTPTAGAESTVGAEEGPQEHPPKVIGQGMSVAEARKRAERIVKNSGVFPGVNALAEAVGCSKSTLDKAVQSSPYLTARKAEYMRNRQSPRSVRATATLRDNDADSRPSDPATAVQLAEDACIARLMEAATPAEQEAYAKRPREEVLELAREIEADPDSRKALVQAARSRPVATPKPR